MDIPHDSGGLAMPAPLGFPKSGERGQSSALEKKEGAAGLWDT